MKKLFFQLPLLIFISFILKSEGSNPIQDNQLIDRDKKIFHNQKDVALTSEIIEILSKQHYVKKPYASIRSKTLNLFIEELDPAKNIFLESEVLPFQDNLNVMNNNINSDLVGVFKLFEIYKNRYLTRHTVQVEFLGQLIEQDLLLNKKIRRGS